MDLIAANQRRRTADEEQAAAHEAERIAAAALNVALPIDFEALKRMCEGAMAPLVEVLEQARAAERIAAEAADEVLNTLP